MYTIITFQCRECGVVVRVLIRDSKTLIFNIIGKNHSEGNSLTESGYFKCIECKNTDNTMRFEKVYN